MAATAAVAASTHHRLLDNSVVTVMIENEHGKDGSQEEEQNLHNAHRKRSLEHRTRLVHIEMLAVVVHRAKRAQRDRHGVSVPAAAVCVGDEAQLVHGSNKSTEEAQVHQRDEAGGALGAAKADHRVGAPEDGDGADDEEHQDVWRRELVVVEEAMDKVCLWFGQYSFYLSIQ